jgi:hypothetical protein
MVIKKNSLPVPNLTFINFFEQGDPNKRPATKPKKKPIAGAPTGL